jgi:hypothetical protein
MDNPDQSSFSSLTGSGSAPFVNRYDNMPFEMDLRVTLTVTVRYSPDIDFSEPGALRSREGQPLGIMDLMTMYRHLKEVAIEDIAECAERGILAIKREDLEANPALVDVSLNNVSGLSPHEWKAMMLALQHLRDSSVDERPEDQHIRWAIARELS